MIKVPIHQTSGLTPKLVKLSFRIQDRPFESGQPLKLDPVIYGAVMYDRPVSVYNNVSLSCYLQLETHSCCEQ